MFELFGVTLTTWVLVSSSILRYTWLWWISLHEAFSFGIDSGLQGCGFSMFETCVVGICVEFLAIEWKAIVGLQWFRYSKLCKDFVKSWYYTSHWGWSDDVNNHSKRTHLWQQAYTSHLGGVQSLCWPWNWRKWGCYDGFFHQVRCGDLTAESIFDSAFNKSVHSFEPDFFSEEEELPSALLGWCPHCVLVTIWTCTGRGGVGVFANIVIVSFHWYWL